MHSFAALFTSLSKQTNYRGEKQFPWAKPAYFHFTSSDFNVHGHILSMVQMLLTSLLPLPSFAAFLTSLLNSFLFWYTHTSHATTQFAAYQAPHHMILSHAQALSVLLPSLLPFLSVVCNSEQCGGISISRFGWADGFFVISKMKREYFVTN